MATLGYDSRSGEFEDVTVADFRFLARATRATAKVTLPAPSFAEAVVVEEEGSARPDLQPTMIVELARGKRVSIFASASLAQVASVLKALR